MHDGLEIYSDSLELTESVYEAASPTNSRTELRRSVPNALLHDGLKLADDAFTTITSTAPQAVLDASMSSRSPLLRKPVDSQQNLSAIPNRDGPYASRSRDRSESPGRRDATKDGNSRPFNRRKSRSLSDEDDHGSDTSHIDVDGVNDPAEDPFDNSMLVLTVFLFSSFVRCAVP